MKLHSESFADGAPIPGEFAFGVPDAKTHVAISSNRNPHLAWSGAPATTQSFVVICHDRDVPSAGDDVNKEGREVPANLPRVDFFHWLLADLPPNVHEIAAGSASKAVTPRGKGGPRTMVGDAEARHGVNDYTSWFAGDTDMGGEYYGYDGPCPPWNDSLVHHYVFTVYAVDVPSLNLPDHFNGNELRAALVGHILDSATLTGTYTLNPTAK